MTMTTKRVDARTEPIMRPSRFNMKEGVAEGGAMTVVIVLGVPKMGVFVLDTYEKDGVIWTVSVEVGVARDLPVRVGVGSVTVLLPGMGLEEK